MTINVWFQYPKQKPEIIDSADTAREAQYLVNEYRLAFGNTGVLWTEGEKFPTILCVDCQEEIELRDKVTNTCTCGTEYNGSGQRLAPRSQWGEETGETANDILRSSRDEFL